MILKYNFDAKTTPFPHQIDAINFLKGLKNAALFDEQGLGKSKVVIDTLCNDIKNKIIDGALIVCKKSLIDTWKSEIENHSYLHSTILSGEQYQRKRFFATFSHFYIINYETVIQEKRLLSKLLNIRKFAMVLDESHKIKNPGSIVCKTIFDLKDLPIKKIIITGTPVANKPEDLWSQFYFLDGGKLLGESYDEFKRKYGIKISKNKSMINKRNLAELRDKINTVSIRRTKDKAGLELPEKVYLDIFVDLKGKQKEMYEHLKNDLYIEVNNLDGQTVIDISENLLKKLLRLTQIASNPYLIDKEYRDDPAKFIKLDSLVKEIIKKGEKVIVWSSFVENIDILAYRYRDYKALKIHGDINIVDRNKAVNWFQKDEDYRILIANPAAAREGLTLTAANNAIYVDRSFNMVDYLQSQDRIHRISQKRKCNIIKLIAKGTVDEYIESIIFKKHEVAKFIQGDSNKIELESKNLTKEEIMEMLGE